MCEPRMKLRPTPVRAIEFLRVEKLKAENSKLKDEINQQKVENVKLQAFLRRKHDEAKPKARALATPATR